MRLRTTALALTLSAAIFSPSVLALSDYQFNAVKKPLESKYMKRDHQYFDGKRINPDVPFTVFFKEYYSPYIKYLDQAVNKFNALSANDQSDPRLGPVLDELQAALAWRKAMNADFNRAKAASKQREAAAQSAQQDAAQGKEAANTQCRSFRDNVMNSVNGDVIKNLLGKTVTLSGEPLDYATVKATSEKVAQACASVETRGWVHSTVAGSRCRRRPILLSGVRLRQIGRSATPS